jgi:DnaJ-class molecular chaperone
MCKQRTKGNWKNRCNECHGKGWVTVYPHNEEIAERRTCPKCRGKGTKLPLDK